MRELNPLDPAQAKLAGMALDHWRAQEWAVQGFGMIRCYLDTAKRWRLNVWHRGLMMPNASIIHDHPWSFQSWVMCGVISNTRFKLIETTPTPPTHAYHTIVTGEDGGPLPDTVTACTLRRAAREAYEAGQTYAQEADEIHMTGALNGTVTLNDRSAASEAHTARVFWPITQEWVDAKPRPASPSEISMAITAAMGLVQCLRG